MRVVDLSAVTLSIDNRIALRRLDMPLTPAVASLPWLLRVTSGNASRYPSPEPLRACDDPKDEQLRAMRSVCLAILLCISLSHRAVGQSLWPVSLELSVGRGRTTTSGEYRQTDNEGPAADVLVSVRAARLGFANVVAAAGLGVQGGGTFTLDCIPSSSGGCIPGEPSISMLAGLIGVEDPRGLFRALAGPVHVYGGDAAVAWQGRINIFSPPIKHLSVGIWVRGTLVPRYEASEFHLLAFGLAGRLR